MQRLRGDDMRRVFRTRRIAVCAGLILALVLFVLAVRASVLRVPGMGGERSSIAQPSVTAQPQSAGEQKGGDSAKSSATAKSTNSEAQSNGHDPSKPFSQAQRREILEKAQQTAAASGKPRHEYHYCVSTKGSVDDTGEFGRTVYATLNDSRGWPRAGLTFVESGSSKCDMTYILAAAEYMKSFSSLCSSQYSCRVGNQVIINYDRWREPTDSWLKGGGNLANYRTMVINHETGHRLDHRDNETVCQQAGEPAPLMQQQSISLRGCTINEWPLDSELWARW